MKTFIHKIEIPDQEITVHEDEILKDFMTAPGELISFMKRALIELNGIDSDEAKLEVAKLANFFERNTLEHVLNRAQEPGINMQDLVQFLHELIDK